LPTEPHIATTFLPSTLATLTGAGAAILGGWASAHFTARQARRRASVARAERRRVLASILLDELANIGAALGAFPDAITRRRFRPLPETPVLDRMLTIADVFNESAVITLLGVREMVRAHRRVSRECHALYRKSCRLPESPNRSATERHLLEVVADATLTTDAVRENAVTTLLEIGGMAVSGDGIATRRFTSGAVEETLHWTALHQTASAAPPPGTSADQD
jgi:hypothetical protein